MRAAQCRQVVLAVSLSLSVFGCGDDDNDNENPNDSGVSTDAGLDSGGPGAEDAQVADAAAVGDAGVSDAGADAGAVADAGAEDAGAGDASADASGPVSFEVVATDYKFSPATLTAAPGQEVTVDLQNDGSHPHNIQFDFGDNPEIDGNVASGDSGSITFTAPTQPGTYVFFCPVGNHRDLGMVGELTVE